MLKLAVLPAQSTRLSGRVADWLVKQGGMPAETQHYVRRITGIPVEEWARVEAKGRAIDCR